MAKRSVFCLCKNRYIIEELCLCERNAFSAWRTGAQAVGRTTAAIKSKTTYHFEDGVNYIFEDGVNFIF